jgi:antitoxin component of RelBE/YafQ-DinJ toxin-antitoxin module
MKETIQIRLSSDTKKQFKAIVNFEGSTVTESIRDFINSKIVAHSQVSSKVKTPV